LLKLVSKRQRELEIKQAEKQIAPKLINFSTPDSKSKRSRQLLWNRTSKEWNVVSQEGKLEDIMIVRKTSIGNKRNSVPTPKNRGKGEQVQRIEEAVQSHLEKVRALNPKRPKARSKRVTKKSIDMPLDRALRHINY